MTPISRARGSLLRCEDDLDAVDDVDVGMRSMGNSSTTRHMRRQGGAAATGTGRL